MSKRKEIASEAASLASEALENDENTSGEELQEAPNGLDRRMVLKVGAAVAATLAAPKWLRADHSGIPRSADIIAFRQPHQYTSSGRLLDLELDVRFANIHVPDPQGPHCLFTRTFNGEMPGPTMKLDAGDSFQPHLVNSLPQNTYNCPAADMNTYHCLNTTNLHTHGLHISPESPGDDVFLSITPQGDNSGDGNDFYYTFDIPADHPGGTHWYHPHHHGSTDYQMKNGMAGALIINDGPGEGLPEIKAAEDVVMVIQEPNPEIHPPPPSRSKGATDHHFEELRKAHAARYRVNRSADVDGCPRVLDYSRNEEAHVTIMQAQAHSAETIVGRLSINGRIDSTLVVAPGEVQRWRLINATVSGGRGYIKIALRAKAGTVAKLHQIAMDGLTLPAVTGVNDLVMAPGNRADFLIQGGNDGDEYELWTEAVGRVDGGGGTQATQRLLTVQVSGASQPMTLPADGTTLPQPASLATITTGEITGERTLTFSVVAQPDGTTDFLIDGKKFDPNVVNQDIDLNAVEEWTIRNTHQNGHPFHIHINPFYVTESLNPTPPDDAEPGWQPQVEAVNRWQDTISVPGTPQTNPDGSTYTGPTAYVKFRTRFKQFTGKSVLHCHILSHEDQGMMQIIEITDPTGKRKA